MLTTSNETLTVLPEPSIPVAPQCPNCHQAFVMKSDKSEMTCSCGNTICGVCYNPVQECPMYDLDKPSCSSRMGSPAIPFTLPTSDSQRQTPSHCPCPSFPRVQNPKHLVKTASSMMHHYPEMNAVGFHKTSHQNQVVKVGKLNIAWKWHCSGCHSIENPDYLLHGEFPSSAHFSSTHTNSKLPKEYGSRKTTAHGTKEVLPDAVLTLPIARYQDSAQKKYNDIPTNAGQMRSHSEGVSGICDKFKCLPSHGNVRSTTSSSNNTHTLHFKKQENVNLQLRDISTFEKSEVQRSRIDALIDAKLDHKQTNINGQNKVLQKGDKQLFVSPIPTYNGRANQDKSSGNFTLPSYPPIVMTERPAFAIPARPPLPPIKPIINQKLLVEGKVRVQTHLAIPFASFVGRLEALQTQITDLLETLNAVWPLLALLQPLLFNSMGRVYSQLGDLLPGLYRVEVATNKAYSLLNSLLPVLPRLEEIPLHAKQPLNELEENFPTFHALLAATGQLLRKVQPLLRRSSIQANKDQMKRERQIPTLLLALQDISNEVSPNVRQLTASWSKVQLPPKLQGRANDFQHHIEQLQSGFVTHIKPVLFLLQPLFDNKTKNLAPSIQQIANRQAQLKKLEKSLREAILPELVVLHTMLSIVQPVTKSQNASPNQVLLYRLRQGINERLYPTVQKLCSLIAEDEGISSKDKTASLMLSHSMDIVNELFSDVKRLKPLLAQVVSNVQRSQSRVSLLPVLRDFGPKIMHLQKLVDDTRAILISPRLKSGKVSTLVDDLRNTLDALQPHLHNLHFLIQKEKRSEEATKLAALQQSIYHLYAQSKTALPVTRKLQKQLSEEVVSVDSMTAICSQLHKLAEEMQPLLSLVHGLIQKLKL